MSVRTKFKSPDTPFEGTGLYTYVRTFLLLADTEICMYVCTCCWTDIMSVRTKFKTPDIPFEGTGTVRISGIFRRRKYFQ